MCHHSHELLVVITLIGILTGMMPVVAAFRQGIKTGVGFGEILYMLGSGIVQGILFILLITLFFVSVTIVMITCEFIKEIGFTGTIQLYRKQLKRLVFWWKSGQ